LLNLKSRKDRSFAEIESEEEAVNFLKANFSDKTLHIKYNIDKEEVKINEFLDDGSLMVVTNPEYAPEDKITVYGLVDRYIEIDLDVEEIRGPGYFKCRISKFRKAQKIRKELRFKVTPEKVIATNFKVSKHTIDISTFNVPTSIKVLLDQFQSQNAHLSEIVKVGTFEKTDKILEHIKKTGETLFVEDLSNPESYSAISGDFVNVKDLLKEELNSFIKKNIEKGYKSMIISPVIYVSDMESSLPFAYIQIVSKRKNFTIESVLELKELIFKLIDRIRDSNTLLVQVHQELIDLSKSGAKLKITDENLKKYMIRSRGFIFDIVFKLQAPITIYGDIRNSYYDDQHNLFIGVDFAGNSSRQDEMKRYYSILDPMIKDYKNRLINERKTIAGLKQKPKK
jgi:hypothetical protein